MKITNVERGSGKTAYLIKKSAEENKPILVTTALRARNLKTKAFDMGYIIPQPISIIDLVTEKYVDMDEIKNNILVDEFDEVFEHLILSEYGLTVEEVTCSIDKQEGLN